MKFKFINEFPSGVAGGSDKDAEGSDDSQEIITDNTKAHTKSNKTKQAASDHASKSKASGPNLDNPWLSSNTHAKDNEKIRPEDFKALAENRHGIEEPTYELDEDGEKWYKDQALGLGPGILNHVLRGLFETELKRIVDQTSSNLEVFRSFQKYVFRRPLMRDDLLGPLVKVNCLLRSQETREPATTELTEAYDEFVPRDKLLAPRTFGAKAANMRPPLSFHFAKWLATIDPSEEDTAPPVDPPKPDETKTFKRGERHQITYYLCDLGNDPDSRSYRMKLWELYDDIQDGIVPLKDAPQHYKHVIFQGAQSCEVPTEGFERPNLELADIIEHFQLWGIPSWHIDTARSRARLQVAPAWLREEPYVPIPVKVIGEQRITFRRLLKLLRQWSDPTSTSLPEEELAEQIFRVAGLAPADNENMYRILQNSRTPINMTYMLLRLCSSMWCDRLEDSDNKAELDPPGSTNRQKIPKIVHSSATTNPTQDKPAASPEPPESPDTTTYQRWTAGKNPMPVFNVVCQMIKKTDPIAYLEEAEKIYQTNAGFHRTIFGINQFLNQGFELETVGMIDPKDFKVMAMIDRIIKSQESKRTARQDAGSDFFQRRSQRLPTRSKRRSEDEASDDSRKSHKGNKASTPGGREGDRRLKHEPVSADEADRGLKHEPASADEGDRRLKHESAFADESDEIDVLTRDFDRACSTDLVSLVYNRYYNSGAGSASLTNDVSKVFDHYRESPKEEPDRIGVQGSIQYLQDIKVKLHESVLLAILSELSSPTMGEFVREGFVTGWVAIGAGNIHLQTQKADQWRKTLSTDATLFKKTYKHTFKIAKTASSQRGLDLEVAHEYWRLLFDVPGVQKWSTPTTPWLQWWIDFTSEKWKKDVTRDMWDQLGLFVAKTREDESLEWCNEESAWPMVIDDFVAYVREKRGGAGAGGQAQEEGDQMDVN